MFKRTRFAAVVAIVVAIVVANTANARPSGSFRGGFSSGKSTAARSIATPRKPAFGSFGKREAQPPAAVRAPQRDSAMSRDLDRRAAQDQAMRTYDARTGQAAPSGGLPPLNPVIPGRSGGNGGSGNAGYAGNGAYSPRSAPSGGATSAPAPVVVRDSNNGWLWGIGGFMLGQAASGHAASPAPAVQQAPAAPAPSSQPNAMAEAAGVNDIGTVAAPVVHAAKPVAQEASILARLAVALLIGGLVWLAWKAFRLMAGSQEVKKNANYSFERN